MLFPSLFSISSRSWIHAVSWPTQIPIINTLSLRLILAALEGLSNNACLVDDRRWFSVSILWILLAVFHVATFSNWCKRIRRTLFSDFLLLLEEKQNHCLENLFSLTVALAYFVRVGNAEYLQFMSIMTAAESGLVKLVLLTSHVTSFFRSLRLKGPRVSVFARMVWEAGPWRSVLPSPIWNCDSSSIWSSRSRSPTYHWMRGGGDPLELGEGERERREEKLFESLVTFSEVSNSFYFYLYIPFLPALSTGLFILLFIQWTFQKNERGIRGKKKKRKEKTQEYQAQILQHEKNKESNSTYIPPWDKQVSDAVSPSLYGPTTLVTGRPSYSTETPVGGTVQVERRCEG